MAGTGLARAPQVRLGAGDYTLPLVLTPSCLPPRGTCPQPLPEARSSPFLSKVLSCSSDLGAEQELGLGKAVTGGGANQVPWGMPGIPRLTTRPLVRATLEPAGPHRCPSLVAQRTQGAQPRSQTAVWGASGLTLGQEG